MAAAAALDSTRFREWSNVAKAIWSLSPLFRTSATVQHSALANVSSKEKWFYIVSLSSASRQLVREQSGHSKWRNSLLTHAYHWQIVPLRSWPWRVICARQRDTESLWLIGKGQCRNRQTSPKGAFEENCIFQSKAACRSRRKTLRKEWDAFQCWPWQRNGWPVAFGKVSLRLSCMLLSSYQELGGERKRKKGAGEKKTEQNIEQPSQRWQISATWWDASPNSR